MRAGQWCSDTGETVTVNFALRNVGLADAPDVVATLQPAGGVLTPSGPQTYGLLTAGGGAVTQAFSFTVQGSCGGGILATLSLTNSGTNLGVIAFLLPIGTFTNVFGQNFDSVIAPGLPSGWTTATSGSQSTWTTTSSSADTAPNSASSAEATAAGVNELVSPVIALPAVATQLTFRSRVNLESDGLIAYDGGVLEIKIGAGAWTDILAAGGTFAAGGYTHTITNDSGNPLGKR